MGDILTSKSGLGRSFFFVKSGFGSLWAVFGQSLVLHLLLLFLGGFFNFSGQYLGSLAPFSGSFWAVLGKK